MGRGYIPAAQRGGERLSAVEQRLQQLGARQRQAEPNRPAHDREAAIRAHQARIAQEEANARRARGQRERTEPTQPQEPKPAPKAVLPTHDIMSRSPAEILGVHHESTLASVTSNYERLREHYKNNPQALSRLSSAYDQMRVGRR